MCCGEVSPHNTRESYLLDHLQFFVQLSRQNPLHEFLHELEQRVAHEEQLF